MQLSAASLSIAGALLTIKKNYRWLTLPFAASALLVSHALIGWCPPLPFLKALGFRLRAEIDKEKFALKAIRGDFDNPIHVPNAVWSAINK